MKAKSQNTLKKFSIFDRKICLLGFILIFIMGCLSIYDVGFYSDELTEQNILRMNIREYVELLGPNDLLDYYNQTHIYGISHSVEKDHGVAPYLFFTPLLPIGMVSAELLSILWHSYTYLLFFMGVVFLFFILKRLFKNDLVAFICALSYFFTPRMFADGLYNNKDMVLISFVFGMIYFGIRFIEKKNYKDAILLGIFAAFATNIKIIGLFVFGMIGLFYLIHLTFHKKWSRKNFFVGLTAIISMFFIFTLITPAIWGSGKFDLFSYLEWCLSESSKFSRWNGSILFEGVTYHYSKGQTLPWYYLPKMILISTPPYLLLFFGVGIGFLVYSTIKKQKEKDALNFYMWMILLCFLVPLLVAFATHVKLYNGWRHFYFLYASFFLIASYGIYRLLQIKKLEKGVYIIVGLFLCFYVVKVGLTGIHNTAYYNIFVNHKDISEEYELDYYGVSARSVLKNMISNEKEDHIYIYGEAYGFNVLENNYLHLKKCEQERITILNDLEDYKKYLEENKKVYIFYNNVYNEKKLIKKHKKVYSATAWGNDVAALYE